MRGIRSVSPTCDCELAFLDAGYEIVAGIDEVGRGALAGPVVAACVVIAPDALVGLSGVVRDSKTMSAAQRLRAYEAIRGAARAVAVGMIAAEEIDRIGIGPANRLALEAAVHALPHPPDALISDAVPIEHPAPQVALIDGDARSVTVAAASIVAKVTRDRLMIELHERFDAYGFQRHVGYGTRAHLEALAAFGPCPEHRRSFAPVRQWIESAGQR